MTTHHAASRTVPISPNRLAIIDSLREAQRKPAIHLLAELDVTRARQMLREHQARSGQRLSFTAFVVHCLARAVDASRTEIVDGQSLRREILSLTVSADHEVVDGAPLARFAARLRQLVEDGPALAPAPAG